MISVQNLDKYFNKNKKNSIHVLNNISLEFPEKGLVVLLGPSGSGKTTLLNVIGGLDKVERGSIQFYDHQINYYSSAIWDKIRTEEVGYIFQNYYLMSDLSVFDNVAFVLKMMGISDKEAINERVSYILEQVGMYRFRKKRASQLSGGQQQRVAIARALVKNPKVIIADEPTGNLDSKNTLEIMNIIKTISLNKLVVLVTHEKEIANFYSDRVIELKDGTIISDSINQNDTDHNFSNENTIYLKDLKEVSKFNDEGLKASLYSDTAEVSNTSIRLIIKNKTLYLDINSPIDKIKIIDKDSHIEVKDEHYKKKTRAEMLETTFDEQKLDHQNLPKEKKMIISFKNSFWIAFKKLLKFGRKGKLMLVIFAISGALVAFSTINLYSILTQNYRDLIQMDERYLEIKSSNVPSNNTQDILDDFEEAANNELFRVNLHQSAASSLSVKLSDDNFKNVGNNIKVEYADQLVESDLIFGTLPTNPNQIVISRGVYSQGNTNDTNFTDIGIWSLGEFLHEKLVVVTLTGLTNRELEVVGIVDRLYKSVYAYDYQTSYYLRGYDTTGIITESEYPKLILNSSSSSYMLFTKDSTYAKNSLESKGYEVKLSSQDAMDQNNNRIQSGLATNLTVSLFLVGGSLLAFYFVMRSSMISRIYEISVYRALGVRKMEIYGSFSVEIILLTAVSGFIGFILTTFLLGYISSSPLSVIFSFRVDLMSVMIGLLILFGSNLFIGLMPLILLLRKTPSQIISSYDM